jgi:hypothetical protein
MPREKIDVPEGESGFVSPPPKPIRVGRQKREDTEKPDSLNTRLLTKAKMLSDSLMERRRELGKTVGEPVKSDKLSEAERKTQYTELIASQEMLFNSLAGTAIVGRDGRLRISTKMVEALVELSD